MGKAASRYRLEDDPLNPRLTPEAESRRDRRLTRRRADPRLNYDNASAWRAPGALVEFPFAPPSGGKLCLLALARVIIKHGATRLRERRDGSRSGIDRGSLYQSLLHPPSFDQRPDSIELEFGQQVDR